MTSVVDSAFVGVIVGGGVTAAVQWMVTPRVQRRIRADDRAERALDELALFLDVDVHDISNTIRSKIRTLRYLEELVADRNLPPDDPRFKAIRQTDLEELTDAKRSLDRAMRTRYRHLTRQARVRWSGPVLGLEVESMRLSPLMAEVANMSEVDAGAWFDAFNTARRKALAEVDSKLEAFDRSRPTRIAKAARKVRHPVATWRSYQRRRASSSR